MRPAPPGARGGRLLALVVPCLVGCATALAPPPVPDAAHLPWTPPAEAEAAPPPPPAPAQPVPPWLRQPGATVSLPQVLDVALRNNPRTRDLWFAARAAAEEVGSRQARYYPTVGFDLSLQRQKLSAVGGRFAFQQSTYGPSLDLSYLLLDFGGRKADVGEARQLLYAADWSHSAALQDVVLQVEAAYYSYVGAKALHAAAEASLEAAEANLAAAQERHDAGVATIADVLQARTQVARARLDVDTFDGQAKAIKGALATAMGLPPDLPVEVGELPAELPLTAAQEHVDAALERALAERPDLAAAQARAAGAQHKVERERAARLPRLTLDANSNRVYYSTQGLEPSDNYAAQLTLRVPLFQGFEHRHDIAQAEAEAGSAEARVEQLRQQILLQVWTAYYDMETAGQRVTASRELLAAATQSAEVASGRYKAGVGSLLDLLAAESALADARAQEVQARADWLLALAQLAHDTGALEVPGAAPAAPPAAADGPDGEGPGRTGSR